MNDLISRPVLLEVLERFKLSLGDIFFRMIVDRVIERIREQPVADTMFGVKTANTTIVKAVPKDSGGVIISAIR